MTDAPKLSAILLATFGGTVYAETPTRTWGTKPVWLDWPSYRLDEMHPLPGPNGPRGPKGPDFERKAKRFHVKRSTRVRR